MANDSNFSWIREVHVYLESFSIRLMSVEETDAVDVISVDKQTGEVILTVSDHLEWSDNLKHQIVLQGKRLVPTVWTKRE